MRISDWSSDVCSSDLPFADKLAVVSHDRRAVGLVDTALPGGGAGSVFDMLMLRIDGEARIFKMPLPALERPDRAAHRRPRLQRLYILQDIETPVRLQDRKRTRLNSSH